MSTNLHKKRVASSDGTSYSFEEEGSFLAYGSSESSFVPRHLMQRRQLRGSQGFWLMFSWIIIFIAGWQILWILQMYYWNTLTNFYYYLIGSVLAIVVMVVIQQQLSPKVYPLFYLAPVANLLIVQSIFVLGSLSLGGLIGISVFLFGLNALILALVWGEASNISTSEVSGLWLSITPISCFVILTAATLSKYFIAYLWAGQLFLLAVILSTIWIILSAGLLGLFLYVERSQRTPPENWFFPCALFIFTVAIIIIVPILYVLLNYLEIIAWAFITMGIVLFGVTAAEFQPLMHYSWGRRAIAITFSTGYFLMLVCVIISLIMVSTWTLP